MENFDIYNRCKQLSRIGDWESLNELMNIYLSAKDSQTKKDARKALRKAKNRKAVMAIIHSAIDNAATDEIRLDLLFTGQLIYRVKFLYDYLVEVVRVKGKVQKNIIEEMIVVSPFSTAEMDELVRYIIENKEFDLVIYRKLDKEHQEMVVKHIVRLIRQGNVSYQMLSLISDQDDFLLEVQDCLKNYLAINPDDYAKILPYIKIESNKEAVFFENQENLFLVYRSLLRNKSDTSKLDSNDFNIQISKAVIQEEELSDNQWEYIKDQIDCEVSSTTNINAMDMSFYLFLRGLTKLNIAYAEKIYVSLYEKTGLYSNRILSEMTEMSIPYAYRVLTNRLLSVNNDNIRRKTIAKLFKYYSANARDTYEHVLELNDENLLVYTKEIAKKYGVKLTTSGEVINSLLGGQSYSLLDRSIVVSELLTRIAKEIKAKYFFVAVGFAYSSGLRMLNPVLDEVTKNNGKNELIVGSLQTYGLRSKNTKIDKTTAEYLNMLIIKNQVQLFTYQNSFYHGKYYYLANDDTAYIIMGSSNISKTAYLSNYELDSLFRVSKGSAEDKQFLNWYQSFRYECEQLKHLNEEEFDTFTWNAEQQAYGVKKVVRVSHSDITDRIDKLTDIDTKRRLNMWLSHNPSEILSNLEIPALDDYIVFLYTDSALAVFESFTSGNAFYSFHYDDFDRLLIQLAKLTKTEMLVVSDFLMRGYHIQDQDKLERKVRKMLHGTEFV